MIGGREQRVKVVKCWTGSWGKLGRVGGRGGDGWEKVGKGQVKEVDRRWRKSTRPKKTKMNKK